MFVTGSSVSNRVTISNTEFDRPASWSALCDNHHYWTILLDGSNDMITMKGNYIHHTSGRGPMMMGNTLLHAVNNEWYAVEGHAFDVRAGSMVVAEGNVFQNVMTPLLENEGQSFSSPSTSANAGL
jgi:pectin lyase